MKDEKTERTWDLRLSVEEAGQLVCAQFSVFKNIQCSSTQRKLSCIFLLWQWPERQELKLGVPDNLWPVNIITKEERSETFIQRICFIFLRISIDLKKKFLSKTVAKRYLSRPTSSICSPFHFSSGGRLSKIDTRALRFRYIKQVERPDEPLHRHLIPLTNNRIIILSRGWSQLWFVFF